MRKMYLIVLLLVLGLSGSGLAAEQNFKAMLSGSEAGPNVKTTAKGAATFELSKDGKELSYKVTVTDIEKVTAAHIHLGKPGKSGPPLAPVAIKEKKAGMFTGTLAEGKITAAELLGSMKGKSLSDLVSEIRKGSTYLNIHTEKYPDGEIRGQIK